MLNNSTISEKDCLNLSIGSFILLDVRSSQEYYEYHIPRAINISVESLDQDSTSLLLTKDKIIVIYCKSGVRSLKAAELLNNFGYKVYNLGGIDNLSSSFIASIGQKV